MAIYLTAEDPVHAAKSVSRFSFRVSRVNQLHPKNRKQ